MHLVLEIDLFNIKTKFDVFYCTSIAVNYINLGYGLLVGKTHQLKL